MRAAVRTIAEKRYRETVGRYFEEFGIGDVNELRTESMLRDIGMDADEIAALRAGAAA